METRHSGSIQMRLLLTALVVLSFTLVSGFARQPVWALDYPRVRASRIVTLRLSVDDEPDEADQSFLFASLRARALALEETVAKRWKTAECTSSIVASLDDWVRRVAVEWPRAVIGTASGSVYVADLTSGKILSRKEGLSGGSGSERDMRLLFGDYDGGGMIAVEICGDVVVSAGRDGGAQMWRMDDDELVPLAELPTDGSVVSAIAMSEEGRVVWLSCLDGTVRKFENDGASTATPTQKLQASESAALCVALDAASGLLVVGTADGGVEIYRAADGAPRGTWRPLAFDGSKGQRGGSTRSVAIATIGTYRCVLAGGSGAHIARTSRCLSSPACPSLAYPLARVSSPVSRRGVPCEQMATCTCDRYVLMRPRAAPPMTQVSLRRRCQASRCSPRTAAQSWRSPRCSRRARARCSSPARRTACCGCGIWAKSEPTPSTPSASSDSAVTRFGSAASGRTASGWSRTGATMRWLCTTLPWSQSPPRMTRRSPNNRRYWGRVQVCGRPCGSRLASRPRPSARPERARVPFVPAGARGSFFFVYFA